MDGMLNSILLHQDGDIMKSVNITDFQKVGFNSDVAPDFLPVNGMTTIENGHFLANRLYAIGGYAAVDPDDGSDVPVLFDPGHLRFVNASAGIYWIIAGCGVENGGSPDDKAIYTYDGTTFRDKSVAAAIYDNLIEPNKWTSCFFNNLPVLTHPQSYPQYQATASATTAFTELYWDGTTKWSTAGMKCSAIASHKNFLFAMDMTEGGTELPYVVRWSDAADPGAMPGSWDETVPTNLAGKVALAAEGGRCLNGATLRDSFIVYRENAIHTFDFVGGQYVFNVRTMSPNIGLAGKHAFVEYRGMHYFISKGDIYRTDGNSLESLLEEKGRISFLGSVAQASIDKSFTFVVPILNEIWFCVPVGSSNINFAYIYNVENGTFTTCNLTETYHIASGHPAANPPTWADLGNAWDDMFGTWLVSSAGSVVDSAYFCTIENGPTKSKLYALNTMGFATDVDFTSTFRREALRLDEDDVSCTVLEVFPHLYLTDSITFKIGFSETPYGAITWSAPQTVTADQRKIDVRCTGKYFAYEFSYTGKYPFYLSGLTFKYVVDGQR